MATTESTELRELYPPIEPYATEMFPVDDTHTIYVEQVGNPDGIPAVVLHGGPGGGCQPSYRQFFNPEVYRIVLFDQRGAGRSTPAACLENNTTWHLVADIEKIREHLGIEKWLVFGGSWGSTLSLAYSETHPDRVTHLVLRGIFMLRRSELEWFYEVKGGALNIYPDAWEEYLAPIPEEERGDMMKAYYARLTSDDKETQLAAAKAWSVWEGSTSKLVPVSGFLDKYADLDFAIKFARIECHYFTNGGFFEPGDQLLRNVDKIRDIPGFIVQGRYDIVCPCKSAWDLHKAWPEAEFKMIQTAGHSASEPEIQSELIKACDRFGAAAVAAKK